MYVVVPTQGGVPDAFVDCCAADSLHTQQQAISGVVLAWAVQQL